MSLIPELPDYIDEELFSDWKQMRKEQRKPVTKTIEKYTLRKLAKFHKDGISVNDCLIQSLENGWQGIFEVIEKREPIPKDDSECVRFGASKNINAKPGESMYNYRQRLAAAL